MELSQSIDEPARARAFVAEWLETVPFETRADAVLLVSELVSNVVRHGALPARMVLTQNGGRLRVVVEDSNPAMPGPPGPPDAAAGGGRGLIIVSSIAAAWGISTAPDRPGKGVWFDLALVS